MPESDKTLGKPGVASFLGTVLLLSLRCRKMTGDALGCLGPEQPQSNQNLPCHPLCPLAGRPSRAPAALAALLGPEATGLSASTITQLKGIWQQEYQDW